MADWSSDETWRYQSIVWPRYCSSSSPGLAGGAAAPSSNASTPNRRVAIAAKDRVDLAHPDGTVRRLTACFSTFVPRFAQRLNWHGRSDRVTIPGVHSKSQTTLFLRRIEHEPP